MNGNMISENDDRSTEGEEYNKLLAHAKNYLPFLKRVMMNTGRLGIQEEHLNKLRSLYEMVDGKRLSTSKLKSCQSVFCSLFAKYHHVLTDEEVETMNSKNLVQFNEDKNKTKSSEIRMISNKSDQKPNSKSEHSSKLSVSSVIKNNTLNNKLDSLELDVKQNNEPIIENIKNGESSIENDDSIPMTNDLPDFSDSRLRLNKFIGFAANASIEKLNKSNTIVSHSELAKQIYDDIIKKNQNTVMCQKMLEGINLDDIDVNHVKKVIESINKTKVIEPPPLPPYDLMDLGATNMKLISSTESNDDHTIHDNKISTLLNSQSTSNFVPNKLTSIREKLNNDINVLHKIGSSNEPKHQKFISALKPGTLLDLENSKTVCSSLHMESIRPVIHLNEKKSDIKSEMITRDPRIKHMIQPPLQTNLQQLPISKIKQSTGSVNIPSLLSLNLIPLKSTSESKSHEMTHSTPMNISSQLELSSNALPGYNEQTNFRNVSVHTNVHLSNKRFPIEHNGNSNQSHINNCKLSTQNQYRHTHNDSIVDSQKNDFNQYSNSKQMHVNTVRHTETMMKYHESSSHKSYNDVGVRRDPRSIKSDKKVCEPQFRSFREFREAKYGKEINSNNEGAKKKKQINHSYTLENEKLKNLTKTDSKNINAYNSLRIQNDSSGIKTFKIPKIKRKEDVVDNYADKGSIMETIGDFNLEKDMKTNKIKGDLGKETKTETIKNMENDMKTNKTNDITEKDTKNEKIQDNDLVKDTKTITIQNINTGKVMKTGKIKINDTERDLKPEGSKKINLEKLDNLSNVHMNEVINEPTSQQCKPKKPKKYSKEKEFEKIVKEAVESLNDDTCGPRTRTRSSVRKKEEIMTKVDLNNSKKIDVTTDNNKELILEDCSKSLHNKSHQRIENVESIETGHNVISSTSKETSEIDSLTDIVCRNNNENIVSSNEINSTADTTSNPKPFENAALMNVLSNSKLISILQDDEKMKRLTMLLESNVVENLFEDKSKNKNILNYEHLDIGEQKKMRKKIKKEKRKQRKMLGKIRRSISGEEFSDEKSKNEHKKFISDGNSMNNESIIRTKIVFDNSNDDENTSSDSENSNDYSSTDQSKLKLSKCKKSKESYGNFEILKDKNSDKTELKDIKIVLAKFDRNMKKSESLNSDVSSNNVQTNDKINVLKPKKPFLGPLSVKLAKEKVEIERSRLQLNTKMNTNTIVSNKRLRCKKSLKKSNTKLKTNSKTLVKAVDAIKSHDDTSIKSVPIEEVSIETPIQNELVITEQKSKDGTMMENNVNEIRSDIKKPKKTELDKLHADISEMYDCYNLLNVSNIRQCRTNKQIDYANTNNVVVSKKSKTFSAEELDSHDDSISSVKRTKATLKPGKKSTLKKNSCKQLVKKKITKPVTTAIINKKPRKLSKLKSKGLKKKGKQLTKKESNENAQLNVCNKETIAVEIPKVLTANDFKDKSYFQTADHSLECKFCDYNAVGLNIVRHYKEQHYEEEVLPSRLSRNCAEILINESIKENFGILNPEQFGDSKSRHKNIYFKCIFCELIFYDFIIFYDHITDHTGEYRYKCKMCEHIYPNENELEKHILEHSNYDTTDGISQILQPNPIQIIKLFGYLCSFCNYVQLHYNNIEKHMTLRHFDEDKKSNGHWTVIRISMSVGDQSYDNSTVDADYLVGCVPPIQYEQHAHQTGVPQAVCCSDSIKIEDCEQPEIDKNVPESTNMLILSPKLSTTSIISRLSEDDRGSLFSEFTLKENSNILFVADLKLELIDSILLFNCFASRCSEIEFSTMVLIDFIHHVELNHQFLIWNKFCEACNHKIEMNFEHCFLKDALEHIISHHLVLKKNKQPNMSNLVDFQKGPSSSVISEEEAPKRIKTRLFTGDMLSGKKNSTAVVQESQQCISVFDNACKTSAEPIVNEIANNDGIEETSLAIFNILSVPEINVNNSSQMNQNEHSGDIGSTNLTENMSPLSMSPLSDDDNLSEIPGQVTVNNGIIINGSYSLLKTDYVKNYFKKAREMPLNVMKTKLAFTEMTIIPKIFGLFKCMDRTCTKIFKQKELFKLHMKLHFSNIEKKKKSQQPSNVEQFKKCIYCFREFEDADSLADHIERNYTYCKYFCPYCFYRAYTHSHVVVHQLKLHITSPPSVIHLEYKPEMSPEKLFVVDYNKFVLPFVCNVGCCSFSSFLHDDFNSHLNEEHQQCDKYGCYICANNNGEQYFTLQPHLLIQHFKLHNINMYQCVFCIYGSEIVDTMLCHLAMEHFEYESICIVRSLVPGGLANRIESLKIIKLNKDITDGLINEVNLEHEPTSLSENVPQKSKKKHLDCPDVLSTAMKTAKIDESTHSSETIVITVPDSAQMTNNTTSAIDNEFIMIDDVIDNKPKDNIVITNVWSQTKNDENDPQQSNDVIIIDDDDDEDEKNTAIEQKQHLSKNAINKLSKRFNQSKRLALPLIALDELFVCKECGIIFSSSHDYLLHLNQCSYYSNGHKCPFCIKFFKTPFNLTEHVKLHGPDRFTCSVCKVKISSSRAITHHMKVDHNIINLEFVPTHASFTDVERDEFIVLENKTTKSISYICEQCSFKDNNKKTLELHMKNMHNINYEQCGISIIDTQTKHNDAEDYIIKIESANKLKVQEKTSTKRKQTDFSHIVTNKKICQDTKDNINEDKTKCLSFSPDTVNYIPLSHIFSEPIGCSLCTYNTKVRSNLITHLMGHKIGQDNTTKEIVNPVPIKSELMFDKMINLSASSFEAMNTEKIKIDELNKKIVEVASQDNLNMAIFPQFIPVALRYKCSIPTCAYIGITEDLLKKHISVLHPDNKSYICPHCRPKGILNSVIEMNKIEFHLMHHGENLYSCQYCDYIDFNRNEMKMHMRNTHLLQITSANQSNIIVIRQILRDDINIDRNRHQARTIAAQWICNICSSGIKYTENEITSHIFMAHNVSNMFKCPMCSFEHKDDSTKVFEEHYKLHHPSVAVKSLKVFEKIADVEIEEQQKQAKLLLSVTNTQEQLALESIEPSLVPPTCRGIPIDTTSSISRTYNKSRGLSKSPKTTKSSPLQARKQKILTDTFNISDSLGTITSNGLFSCPRCNAFDTMNIDHFREHLIKDVNYKIWKCMQCCEISDSPKKMAWHVKKHGTGIKYEKIECAEKLLWVKQVIKHQYSLIHEFKEKSKDRHINSIEQKKTLACDKKSPYFSLKNSSDTESEKKENKLLSNDDIIDLLDDSDE